MLYESNDNKVALEKELQYLQNYIDLQKIRFGHKAYIDFKVDGLVTDQKIVPLLLIAFIENAFKHGVGLVEDPQINIVLSVDDATGWLDFKVMNSVAPQQHTKDKSSGIGLHNVRRRLELLYKEDYKLDIMQNESVFIAELELKLK